MAASKFVPVVDRLKKESSLGTDLWFRDSFHEIWRPAMAERFPQTFSGAEYKEHIAWVDKWVTAKKKDPFYANDKGSLRKRGICGRFGELTIERWFGRKITEDGISEDARDFNHCDLSHLGINAGIKASTVPNSPLFNFKEAVQYDQIICLLEHNEVGGVIKVYIMGVGRAADLAQNCDMCFIKDPFLVKKGTKKAIYCPDLLAPLPRAFNVFKEQYTKLKAA